VSTFSPTSLQKWPEESRHVLDCDFRQQNQRPELLSWDIPTAKDIPWNIVAYFDLQEKVASCFDLRHIKKAVYE
jgi:hypothetical protein